MPQNIYIAKQPIMDIDDNIFAYELLFRTQNSEGDFVADIKDGRIATAKVLVNALNHIGIDNIVGTHKAFINLDTNFLLDDLVLTIPKEKFIIEILEDVLVTKEIIARIVELKKLGYLFALDDMDTTETYFENFTPLLPLVSYVKLDASLIEWDKIDTCIAKLNEYDIEILAEKIETPQMLRSYRNLGCTLFQGYYFAKPELIEKKAIDPYYKNLFQLINDIDADLSIDELALEFESNIDITVQLLHFLNSASFGMKKEISSIKHAMTLLGRKTLKQWLLLIAYSKQDQAHSAISDNALLDLASSRANIMSNLMIALKKDKSLSHEAAFIGLLSLIDVIIHADMDTILRELHVNQSVHEAIVEHKGVMGSLLELIESIETFDMLHVNKLAKEMHLSDESIHEAMDKVLIEKQ